MRLKDWGWTKGHATRSLFWVGWDVGEIVNEVSGEKVYCNVDEGALQTWDSGKHILNAIMAATFYKMRSKDYRAVYFFSIASSASFRASPLYHNQAASVINDPNPPAMIILPLKPCLLLSASSPPRMTTAFFDQVYSSPL